MWTVLKQTDLERVRQELAARRGDAQQRHAAELAAFEAELAELETLRQLATSFAGKFRRPAPPPAPPAAPPSVPPISRPQQHEGRRQPLTNFEMFRSAAGRG
jgi:hypothetical protein